ncbi:Putative pancortin-3 (fragment) [Xanthomonas citri pv. fuscans]
MTITQDWDRVRIHLDAGLSKSNSDVAGLVSDPIEGFVLLYSYRNEPKAGETQLNAHRGFARLVFAKDMKSGNGDYFTGDGRHSSGNFTLRKQ